MIFTIGKIIRIIYITAFFLISLDAYINLIVPFIEIINMIAKKVIKVLIIITPTIVKSRLIQFRNSDDKSVEYSSLLD